jgi:Na+/melibiose symporter-like transporter
MRLLSLLAQTIDQSQLEIPKTGVNVAGGNNSTIGLALQIVLGIAGAIAFLIIVIAGFRYVTSEGNPQTTSKAKNTIIYATVGLIVITLAFSIVKFVLRSVN